MYQIIIFGFVSLWCTSSIEAQPDDAIQIYLLKGNKFFQQGDYQDALVNYEEVIARQPSNNFVMEQMAKANEELLYAKLSQEESPEADCRLYISKYGDDGKYILNVKNLLSQQFSADAYKDYHNKDIEALENIYVEYLTILGTERSGEMKQWLYLLCNEKAKASLKKKDWSSAKEYFEKSLKYTSTDKESENAQDGITKALKKKKR